MVCLILFYYRSRMENKRMPKVQPLIEDADNVITLAEAARVIKRSHGTAWAWALRGKLPAQEVAGRFLVRRCDAERLAQELEAEESVRASA
jgi:hypothetical protein